MAQTLNRRAFILSFGLLRIDRRADVGNGRVFFDLNLTGITIDTDLGAAHAGFPKQRKRRAQTRSGSHVSSADELAAWHAEVCGDNFSVAQALAVHNSFAVVQRDRAPIRVKRLRGGLYQLSA